jgi:alcohol oxidase
MSKQIFSQVPGGLTSVDVIIAGGGTAGCVVASRLSDLLPNVTILVVERGRDNWQDPAITQPLYFLENILNTGSAPERMMYYQGKPEENLGGRAQVVPAGSTLGGGSAINMLTYARPQREDLDGWMPGWKADDMLEFFKMYESYYGPGSDQLHGKDGPIKVSASNYGPTQFQDQFVKAAAKAGIPEALDLQNFDSNHAVQRNLRFISPDGVRSDAAHAYLHPRLRDGKHRNLQVLVEHEVTKVTLENGRAVGVEVRGTPGSQNHTETTRSIRAKKMVIVTGGTLGTPLILQRSGVGDKSVLDAAGVEVAVHLPGVGSNFNDHNTMIAAYYTSLKPNETYDDLLSGKTTFLELLEKKAPMLAWNSAEITSKVRPTSDEIALLPKEARDLWDRDFEDVKNKPVGTISTAGGFIAPIPEGDEDERFLSTGNFLLYPYAHGHVRITGPSPDDEIDLKTGILTDPAGFDLAMAKWLYKKQREVVRRLPVYRGEWAPIHPPFAADSEAVAKKLDGPLPEDVADISYTAEDEAVLDKWVVNNLSQNWHGIGTCKMAPEGEKGVVDPSLGVYGVQGLKVADLSIVPVNAACNTASVAFAIAEKAAVIFAKELQEE